MSYISHAVRRGLEYGTSNIIKRSIESKPEIEVPKWGIALFVFTVIAFMIFTGLVEYTLKDVVATLAMVETPSAAITVSPSTQEPSTKEDAKDGLLESGPTITLVRQKPITSSIRGTIRHLVSQIGRTARFRGIRAAALYGFCFSIVANLLEAVTPRIPGRLIFIAALAGAATANLHAAWTHRIISMPATNKRFFKSIPGRASWKQLAFPAAVKASAGYVTVYITKGLVIFFGLNRLNHENVAKYNGKQWTMLILAFAAVIVTMICSTLFIVLPATVTLVRVEASMLPEDEDTVVPFDRTFDGKVVPKILGGTGAIGFVDAWRGFNWEARRRLVKLYVKIFFIMTAIMIVFVHVVALETWAVMGPAIGKYLAQMKHDGFQQMRM